LLDPKHWWRHSKIFYDSFWIKILFVKIFEKILTCFCFNLKTLRHVSESAFWSRYAFILKTLVTDLLNMDADTKPWILESSFNLSFSFSHTCAFLRQIFVAWFYTFFINILLSRRRRNRRRTRSRSGSVSRKRRRRSASRRRTLSRLGDRPPRRARGGVRKKRKRGGRDRNRRGRRGMEVVSTRKLEDLKEENKVG